jgi:hypothetical protein
MIHRARTIVAENLDKASQHGFDDVASVNPLLWMHATFIDTLKLLVNLEIPHVE